MYVTRLTVGSLGHLDRVSLPFVDESGKPRLLNLLYAGGGLGKTTLLSALGLTRPGHASVLPRRASASGIETEPGEPEPGWAVTEWLLGSDEPERPHPLCVASPNAKVFEDDERELLRRREQLLFERVAREGGYAFVAISGARWFSRQPLAFSAPLRTIARYDVRGAVVHEDITRSDVARETKQALAYAAIASALAHADPASDRSLLALGEAMKHVVGSVIEVVGFRYQGIAPHSFEPLFQDTSGRVHLFDALPTRIRHLVAFAALPVRTLWAAYPGRDPRQSEGVVTIDDVELHQDLATLPRVIGALHAALPGVQWILSTSSAELASSCEEAEVLALRQLPERGGVELFTGSLARTH